MRLKDFQIGAKLMAGFIVVLVLAAAQTLYAAYGAAALNDNAQVMADRWLPATRHAGLLDGHVNRLRATQFLHLLSFSEDDRRDLEKQMDEMGGQIDQELQNLNTMLVETEQQQLLQTLSQSWQQYQTHRAEITDLARQRRDEEALEILKGPALQTYNELGRHLRTLSVSAQEGAQQTRGDSTVIQNRVFYGNLAALLVTIVLGLLIARTLSHTIAGGARFAAQLAQRVARGDLSVPIHANSRDEFGQLLAALREMQDALSALVRRVREGSEAVASASAEIAQGNQDLSARTENQASSLEETAASMEQLGAAVRHNADNAQQADQLAQTASTIVTDGGAAVTEVVNTMKGISASSKKIADIINVIDGIAFQTNILALNAAVEAARAGEQGKGFAVVASEVRALAGRSAAAAKEIKGLINDSVQRIEQGTAQADRAGTTMGEVVTGIRRVTGLITEISAASREQSEGVAQVGEAISHMDRNTQQNAALVEQMSAAAASLRSQAEQLVQTVAVFKLADGSTAATSQPAALQAPSEPRLIES